MIEPKTSENKKTVPTTAPIGVPRGVRFYQIADINFSDSVNGVNYYDQICFLKYNITFHHSFYYIIQVICITTWNLTYDVIRFVLFVLHI